MCEFLLLNAISWSLLNIATSLLMLQVELVKCFPHSQIVLFMRFIWFFCIIHFQSKESLEFGILTDLCNKLLYAYGLLAVYCEVGHRLSAKFEGLSDILCECDLHLLPIDLQRQIPIVLFFMQNTPALTSYGNLGCSRETFKRVRLCFFIFTMWLGDVNIFLNFYSKFLLYYIFRFPKMVTLSFHCFVHFNEFVSKLNKSHDWLVRFTFCFSFTLF